MEAQTPTILVYGRPSDQTLIQEIINAGWGLVLDDGFARDPIFTIYENFARADAFIALPTANPIHILTLLAEGEVGHPLMIQGKPKVEKKQPRKPVVFLGSEGDWAPFKAIFDNMKREGTTREIFDSLAEYIENPTDCLNYIQENLPDMIPSTRVNYYLHVKKDSTMSLEAKEDGKRLSATSVSFLGSASTKKDDHIQRAFRAAEMCNNRDWNILHGGGKWGVMGALSERGHELGSPVIGISVHETGAPKIFFETEAGAGVAEEISEFWKSKDMIHRIESYARNSHAFVALDGGIGTVQEALVLGELIRERHPSVRYRTESGELAIKPFYLVNSSRMYDPLVEYLREQDLPMKDAIQVVLSLDELETELVQHFEAYPPVLKDRETRLKSRDLYREELPLAKTQPRSKRT